MSPRCPRGYRVERFVSPALGERWSVARPDASRPDGLDRFGSAGSREAAVRMAVDDALRRRVRARRAARGLPS